MLRSAVELAEEGRMICEQDILIVAHNLKGDLTTSVVVAGDGYAAHGQGFISGAHEGAATSPLISSMLVVAPALSCLAFLLSQCCCSLLSRVGSGPMPAER